MAPPIRSLSSHETDVVGVGCVVRHQHPALPLDDGAKAQLPLPAENGVKSIGGAPDHVDTVAGTGTANEDGFHNEERQDLSLYLSATGSRSDDDNDLLSVSSSSALSVALSSSSTTSALSRRTSSSSSSSPKSLGADAADVDFDDTLLLWKDRVLRTAAWNTDPMWKPVRRLMAQWQYSLQVERDHDAYCAAMQHASADTAAAGGPFYVVEHTVHPSRHGRQLRRYAVYLTDVEVFPSNDRTPPPQPVSTSFSSTWQTSYRACGLCAFERLELVNAEGQMLRRPLWVSQTRAHVQPQYQYAIHALAFEFEASYGRRTPSSCQTTTTTICAETAAYDDLWIHVPLSYHSSTRQPLAPPAASGSAAAPGTSLAGANRRVVLQLPSPPQDAHTETRQRQWVTSLIHGRGRNRGRPADDDLPSDDEAWPGARMWPSLDLRDPDEVGTSVRARWTRALRRGAAALHHLGLHAQGASDATYAALRDDRVNRTLHRLAALRMEAFPSSAAPSSAGSVRAVVSSILNTTRYLGGERPTHVVLEKDKYCARVPTPPDAVAVATYTRGAALPPPPDEDDANQVSRAAAAAAVPDASSNPAMCFGCAESRGTWTSYRSYYSAAEEFRQHEYSVTTRDADGSGGGGTTTVVDLYTVSTAAIGDDVGTSDLAPGAHLTLMERHMVHLYVLCDAQRLWNEVRTGRCVLPRKRLQSEWIVYAPLDGVWTSIKRFLTGSKKTAEADVRDTIEVARPDPATGQNAYRVEINEDNEARVRVQHERPTHLGPGTFGFKAVQDGDAQPCLLEVFVPQRAQMGTSVHAAGKLRTDIMVPTRLWRVVFRDAHTHGVSSAGNLVYTRNATLIPHTSDVCYSFFYEGKHEPTMWKLFQQRHHTSFNGRLDEVCVSGWHFCMTEAEALQYHDLRYVVTEVTWADGDDAAVVAAPAAAAWVTSDDEEDGPRHAVPITGQAGHLRRRRRPLKRSPRAASPPPIPEPEPPTSAPAATAAPGRAAAAVCATVYDNTDGDVELDSDVASVVSLESLPLSNISLEGSVAATAENSDTEGAEGVAMSRSALLQQVIRLRRRHRRRSRTGADSHVPPDDHARSKGDKYH